MALAFSPQTTQKIDAIRARYPTAQAACLPVLHVAQSEFGYLSDDAIRLVAATLGLPEAHVFGVVTFYTMFHREPVGRNVLRVCTNVACMLRGGYDVLRRVGEKLGVAPGGTSKDGITVIEEECLAACADAPMAICGQTYYLRLDDAKVDAMLDELRRAAGSRE
ncbi:MAG TPA: NAD(P)H-dependent oxidoreductase subunit E [Polyangiaceae bacterium]|nr:NAD(P)H-dependent oxidoreductase subunit E [Polyangiaceae bacterium]